MASELQGKNDPPILIVDDDPSFLSILTATFSKAGWRYDVAISGHSAMRHLRRTRYVVAFLDYALPDINGVEMLRWIQSLSAPPPVVLISGRPTPAVAFGAGTLGAIAFLEKPVEMGDLEDIVKRLLDQPAGMLVSMKSPIIDEAVTLMMAVVRHDEDVPTVSDWASIVCLTPVTLRGRCARLGLTAKQLLDLARLLRVVAQRSTSATSRLMFASVDPRTLLALVQRAGLSRRQLDVLSVSDFLNKQRLVCCPPLLDRLMARVE
jgi:DNA-binding response OmpR family regulator